MEPPPPADVGIVREWIVGFKTPKPQNWFHGILCRGGFTHCYLLGLDRRSGAILSIETLLNFTDVRLITQPELDAIIPTLLEHGPLLFYRSAGTKGSNFLRPFSCVATISHALGIRLRPLANPQDLYQALIADGATVITAEASDGIGNGSDRGSVCG